MISAFLTLEPNADWQFPDIYIGGVRALVRQEAIISELRKFGSPDHFLARCTSDGMIRRFESPIDGLQSLEKFPNRDELELKASREMGRIIHKCGPTWKGWFETLFANVSVWSDGAEVVLVWGVELQENNRFVPLELTNDTATDPDESQLRMKSAPQIDGGQKEKEIVDTITHPIRGAEPIASSLVGAPVKSSFSWQKLFVWLLIAALVFALFKILIWCMAPCSFGEASAISGREVVNPLPRRLPELPNAPVPWSPEEIISDPVTGHPIVRDRWNIAYTNKQLSFASFVNRLDSLIPESDGMLIYWDEMIGRVQLDWQEDDVAFPSAELKLKLEPFQALIWPERLMSMSTVTTVASNETLMETDWHLKSIGWESNHSIDAQKVGLAIVDDGFDLLNSGLSDQSIFAMNLDRRDSLVDSSEARNHGTHVASLACAMKMDDSPFQGVTSSAKLIPIQISNSDEPLLSGSNIIDGILYGTRRGAKVINLSLSSYYPGLCEMSSDQVREIVELSRLASIEERSFWRYLFASLEDEGVVVVMAAGNDGVPLEMDPMHESIYPIYVTATTSTGDQAGFSNYRTSNDDSLVVVSAPGADVFGRIPGGELLPMSGTSMSAPIVAGAIIELLSINGNLSPQQVRERIQQLPRDLNTNDPRLWIPTLLSRPSIS